MKKKLFISIQNGKRTRKFSVAIVYAWEIRGGVMATITSQASSENPESGKILIWKFLKAMTFQF